MRGAMVPGFPMSSTSVGPEEAGASTAGAPVDSATADGKGELRKKDGESEEGGAKRRKIEEEQEGIGTGIKKKIGKEDKGMDVEEKEGWPDPQRMTKTREFVLTRLHYLRESAKHIGEIVAKSKRMSGVEKDNITKSKEEMLRYGEEMAKMFKVRTEWLEGAIRERDKILDGYENDDAGLVLELDRYRRVIPGLEKEKELWEQERDGLRKEIKGKEEMIKKIWKGYGVPGGVSVSGGTARRQGSGDVAAAGDGTRAEERGAGDREAAGCGGRRDCAVPARRGSPGRWGVGCGGRWGCEEEGKRSQEGRWKDARSGASGGAGGAAGDADDSGGIGPP
ncbi:keratin, type I cytoskeletal 9-like [Odontomachus brunneus]|uniref:keratin, type I cytoskeletal 9-like n=1 Tax=Odontomachus brunneus TaxID=486640 RepID=UPI0013F2AB73|nr:keratin, type I cytoskeletal 9-like [Odontomachus brunneus]